MLELTGRGTNTPRAARARFRSSIWAHCRRRIYEVHERQVHAVVTLAHRVVLRIGKLYAIEQEVRRHSAEHRLQARHLHAKPLQQQLHRWLQESLAQISTNSHLAGAIGYAQINWRALKVYVGDGRVEINSNTAERVLRSVVMGRKNHLHIGSDSG